MPARWITLFVICISANAGAQTMPTTKPEALRKARIEELELKSAHMPKLPATMPSDVVRFGLEDSRITLTAPLGGKEREARILCDQLPGVVTLTSFSLTEPWRQPSQNFIFVREDLTNSSVGDITVVVSAAAGRVLLSRDTESDTFLSSIELIQDPPGIPPSNPPQEPLRLSINIENLAQQQTLLKVNVGAKDFIDLRRHQAQLVDQYLRPIFRELDQESLVFGIPPEVAWQVLGFVNEGTNPGFQKQVKSIVDALGADDFHQRQTAAAELKTLGKPAAAELARLDRNKLSPEQNTAIDSFLADAVPLSAEEAEHWASDKNFLLDVLFSDERALHRKALDRLSEIEGRKVELEFEPDPIRRAQAVNKLRDQLVRSSLPSLDTANGAGGNR